MNIKDRCTQLALALILKILLTGNNIAFAVVAPGQYSSYQPQSYYSHSLSSYGNENQNYFDNPAELSPANGYSSETYQQPEYSPQISYGTSGVDSGDEQNLYQQADSFQPQTSYQDYLSGNFSPFRQEQDFALDTYGRYYSTRLTNADGRGTSSLVSFDNIDSNNSGVTNYESADDVVYPPLDSRLRQQYQQYQQQGPMQQYLHSADYMTANSSLIPMPMQMQYLSREREIPKDNGVSSSANTQTMAIMTRSPTPLRNTQMNVHHELSSAKPYSENDNQEPNQQDQQYIQRKSQHQPQPPTNFEAQFNTNNNDKLLSSSQIRSTYYVADSDLSASRSSHLPDTQPLSLLHSHLVQLPVVSSPPPAPLPPPSFSISSEPIPISKHVEITKHIPVPIYRQIHVPVRKPVRIEIPRPVISTARRPYPIHIPTVTKTVAVPLVKEVKIPIDKVTPYPVEHKVPYVVEKRVPFQVEKQVATPKYYPFPVKVPMVRTVIHKKKSYLPMLRYHPRFHM